VRRAPVRITFALGAAVVVPLTHLGQVLGAYTLFFAEKRDTPEELGLLFRSISEHLGMALENARLLRENMRMTLVRERQLMANEVHDSLAQTMAYMKIRLTLMQEALDASEQAQASKHAGEVQQALDGAYADLRELLSQFRTRMDPLGLVHALEELKTKFHDRTGIELAFDNRTTNLGLSVEEEGQVFHIMQEALANVARHSGAKHARLTMELAGGEYRFTVEDDGLGFYAFSQRTGGGEQPSHLRHHLGVNIMRERAQRLDGAIEISNLPEGGARVSLVFSAKRGANA
jgi:two-component system nitrate/nitrite sensor histidine kinase NarX